MSVSTSSTKQALLTRMQELQNKQQSLQATIDKVLHFPEKVSYDVMVPMSKVAFYPARLIHTNEFKVLREGQTEADLSSMDFISHVEAANVLRTKLQPVTEELESLQEKIGEKSSLSTKPKSAMKKSGAEGSSNVDQKTSIATESVVSNKVQEVQKPQEDTITKALEKAQKEEKEFLASAATKAASSSIEPVFEIREFLDESGNLQTEVMDVSKQLQFMEQLSQQHSEGSNGAVDEELKFVQELTQITSQVDYDKKTPGNVDDNDDFDTMMEMLLKLGEKENKTSSTVPVKKAPTTSASGWKSGFFGSNTSKATTKKEKEATSAQVKAEVTEQPQDIGQGNAKKGVSFATENEVRTIDTQSTKSHAVQEASPMPPPPPTTSQPAVVNKAVSNDVLEKPPQAPKPFGNTIVEKNVSVAPKPLASKVVERSSHVSTPTVSTPVSNTIVEKDVQAPKPFGNAVVEKAPSGPKPLPMSMAKKKT